MKAALVIALTLVVTVCELLVEAVSGETLAEFPDVDDLDPAELDDLHSVRTPADIGWLR